MVASAGMRLLVFAAALLSCARPTLQERKWERLAATASGDLRAISGRWASGAHGSWRGPGNAGALPGDLDFRSLHAFDDRRAVMVNAGAPARFYFTDDGGAHWTLAHEVAAAGIFFDSMAFWNERDGLALGDPVSGRFAGAVSHDGGRTWQDVPGPVALEGEGAFAASNTCLALHGEREAWFASASRVFHSRDGGATWTASVPGLAAAQATGGAGTGASAGIFSIAFRDAQRGYLTGGDYLKPASPGLFARTTDGGATWTAGAPPRGYRSSIAIAFEALVVAGTSGSDFSLDEGRTWSRLGDEPLNAVAQVDGELFAAGPKGAVFRLR